jgi:cytoskeletal protein CcmA (bactofilin family)
MSDLSNLYISESYFGIINLEDSELPLVSQSGDINLQDGIGDNIGLKINAQTKKFTIVNDLQVDGNADFNGDIDISGSFTHTGSIDVIGDVTIVGNLTAHTGSFDTINTRILHVTLESSSVIFSSGSNVFGDEITDTQTLVGQVSISGSLSVDGNSTITGSLSVTNEISSSTINGIGNVTTFSSSVDFRINNLSSSVDTTITNLSSSLDSRLDYLEGPFSTSVDARLVSLENFSSSLVADFVTDVEYSASIAVVTGSLINQIDTKLDSSSFNTWTGSVFAPFSSSVSSDIDTIYTNISTLSSSIATTDLNQQNQINSLISVTGSYATTGSNTFVGNEVFSGSVQGIVIPLSVSSQTASMDCNLGNFFTLAIPTGSNTHISATNIKPGLTITLQLNQNASSTGTVTFSPTNFNFPRLNLPNITQQTSALDVATFVSFNSSVLNGTLTNDLI